MQQPMNQERTTALTGMCRYGDTLGTWVSGWFDKSGWTRVVGGERRKMGGRRTYIFDPRGEGQASVPCKRPDLSRRRRVHVDRCEEEEEDDDGDEGNGGASRLSDVPDDLNEWLADGGGKHLLDITDDEDECQQHHEAKEIVRQGHAQHRLGQLSRGILELFSEVDGGIGADDGDDGPAD